MNFSNLEYFIVAAEELNFTSAARKLYISQQSLSNHIAIIEAYFDVRLFDRTPPMTLTPAGQSLLENARAMLLLREQMEREIVDIKDFRSGAITIGVTHARGTVILPMILPAFHKQFPQVKINLFEGTSAEIEEALYKGKVDMTIGFQLDNPASVVSDILLEERSVIVAPKQILFDYFDDHGASLLARQVEKVPLTSFRHCPFVAIKATTWAGAIFDDCCREFEIVPNIVVQTANITTMISLCLAGMGISVCPAIFVTQLSQRNLLPDCNELEHTEIFPLDYAPTETYIAINYLKGKYMTLASREFIRMARNLLRNLL